MCAGAGDSGGCVGIFRSLMCVIDAVIGIIRSKCSSFEAANGENSVQSYSEQCNRSGLSS